MSDSSQNQTAKYGIDISDFVSKMGTIEQAYKRQEATVGELTGKHIEFNKAGEAVKVTMKGIIDGNKDSAASFKLVKVAVTDAITGLQSYERQWKLTAATLSGNTEVKRSAEEEARRKSIQQKRDIEMYKADVKMAKDAANEKVRIYSDLFDQIDQREKIQQKRDKEMYDKDVKAFQAAQREKQKALDAEEKKRNEPTGFDKFKNQAAAIASGMAIFGGLSLGVNSLKSSIDDAASMERKISEIRTLSQDSQLSTDEWTASVRKLSDTYGVDLKDTMEGVYQTLSNQIAHGKEVLPFMEEAMRFGSATMISTTDSVQLLSAGINAFGLEAKDAKMVGGEFFKMIDLGRIRGQDLAYTMGSTLPLAHQLGLSFDEVGAAISTMTNQGIKADTAQTYLRNLMLSLIKPSQEMKRNFDAWGVSGGDAAFKTFGLVGVLQKLNDIGEKGGLTELTKSLKNMRGLQGDLLFAGEGLEKLEKNLEKFRNKDTTYSSGKDISFESPGKQFQIEMQKISNIVTVDFGKPLLDGIIKITNAFGGLASLFKQATGILAAGAAGWTAYGVAMTAARFTAGGWMTTIVNIGGALGYVAGAIRTVYLAMMANPWTAIFTIVAGAIAYWAVTSKSAEQQLADTAERVKAYQLEAEQNAQMSNGKSDANFKASMDKQYQYLYGTLANIRSQYHTLLDGIKQQLDAITIALKESMDTYNSSLQSMIAETKGQLNELKSIIKEGEGKIRDFKEKREFKEFEQKTNAYPFRKQADAEVDKSDEMRGRMEQYYKQAREAFFAGNYADAKEMFHKAETQLETSLALLDKAQDHYNKALEKGGFGGKKGNAEAGKLEYQKAFNVAASKQKEISDQILKNEEDMVNLAIVERGEKEKLLQTQKDLQKETKKLFSEAIGIKLGAKDDPATIQEKLDRLHTLQEKFSTDGMMEGVSVEAYTNIIAQLQQKEETIRRIVDVKQKENVIDKARMEAEKVEANQAADRTRLTARRDILEKDMSDSVSKLKDFMLTVIQANTYADTKNLGENIDNFNKKGNTFEERLDYFKKIRQAMKELEASQPNTKTFKPENFIQDLDSKILDTGIYTVPLAQIEKTIKGMKDLDVQTKTQTAAAKELADAYKSVFDTNTDNVIKNNDLQLKSFQNSFDEVKKIMNQAGGFNFKVQIQPQADDNGDNAIGLARGGRVPGGPRGTDTVPAWLTPGEFVVNASATRQFHNELVAMNRGVQYHAAGGYVHNNSFGNINVSLSGGQHTAASAREIAIAIRREISRGTVPPLDGRN